MKKFIELLTIIMFGITLVGCTTINENKEEQPIELDYGFILDAFWEKYHIDSYWDDSLDIDSISQINVIGLYTNDEYSGEDYTVQLYLGDEGVRYTLEILITFNEESDNHIHHYTFTYTDQVVFGYKDVKSKGSFQALDSSANLNEYVESIKQTVLDNKQRYDENMDSLPVEDIIYESQYIEDSFTVKNIKHYLPTITDMVFSDSILYMVYEDEVSVAGMFYTEPYLDLVIKSEVMSKPVTKIYEGAIRYVYLTSLTIPSTIREIGVESFLSASIKTMYFEDESELELIERRAFKYFLCRDITIPISVTTIGDNAFLDVSKMCEVHAEATERPPGWSEIWNSDEERVIWEYTE